MRYSANFTEKEFLVSESHPELLRNFELQTKHRQRLKFGVATCLQPWRHKHPDVPLKINSGFRSLALNSAVGGSPDSDHMQACAVDLQARGKDAMWLFLSILAQGLPFRQLIYYQVGNFVHWSWNVPGREIKHELILKMEGVAEWIVS